MRELGGRVRFAFFGSACALVAEESASLQSSATGGRVTIADDESAPLALTSPPPPMWRARARARPARPPNPLRAPPPPSRRPHPLGQVLACLVSHCSVRSMLVWFLHEMLYTQTSRPVMLCDAVWRFLGGGVSEPSVRERERERGSASASAHGNPPPSPPNHPPSLSLSLSLSLTSSPMRPISCAVPNAPGRSLLFPSTSSGMPCSEGRAQSAASSRADAASASTSAASTT